MIISSQLNNNNNENTTTNNNERKERESAANQSIAIILIVNHYITLWFFGKPRSFTLLITIDHQINITHPPPPIHHLKFLFFYVYSSLNFTLLFFSFFLTVTTLSKNFVTTFSFSSFCFVFSNKLHFVNLFEQIKSSTLLITSNDFHNTPKSK